MSALPRTGSRCRAAALALTLGLALGLAIAPQARAMAPEVPCEQARVFPGAALNVLVLPYRFTAAPEVEAPELDSIGNDLSALLELDILHSLLKYHSVGTMQLVPDRAEDPECDPQRILGRVLGEDAPPGVEPVFGEGPEARPGSGLILLWGRVFAREGELYLQSYARFLRRGAEETIDVTLPGGGKLTGRLSLTAIPFGPRRITRAELTTLAEAAPETRRLRRAPDLESPVVHELEPGSAYLVLQEREGWMELRVYDNGQEGWIRARTAQVGTDLRRLLPELAFLDGVAAYLRYRAGETEGIPPAPGSTSEVARQRIAWYDEFASERGEGEALAVGEVLSGFLDVLEADGDAARLQAAAGAAPRFARARRLVPQNADLWTLEATGRAAGAAVEGEMRGQGEAIVEGFLDALAVQPDNLLAAESLASFYRYLRRLGPEGSPFSPDELDGRLATVERVRSYLRDKGPRER